MEVAGLVLGAFPLLVEAMKAYPEAARTFREWRRFRTAIEGYSDTLSTQRMVYWDRVIELLEGVVAPDELKKLYDGQGLASLSDIEGSDAVLEQRLGSQKYELFQKHSRRIDSSLEDIKKLLRMDENSKIPWERAGFIGRERGKFLLVVNKGEFSDICNRIREANADLEALTKRNVLPYSGAASKNRVHKASYHEDVNHMRRKAKSLHKAITASQRWKCPCRKHHTICISLGETRPSKEYTKAKLLISFRTTAAISEDAWQAIEAHFIDVQQGKTNTGKPVLQVVSNPVQSKQPSKNLAMHAKKGVTFMLPKPTLLPLRSLEPPNLPAAISDLCEVLRQTREKAIKGRIGCIEIQDEPWQCSLFFEGLVPSQTELITLRGILERSRLHQGRAPHHQSTELLWEDSLRLAVQLALSVLRMEGSWIKGELKTENVLFNKLQHEASVQDLISQDEPKCGPVSPVSPLVAHLIRSQALFSLGLILVELAFGQLLESLRTLDEFDSNERLQDLKTATRILPHIRGNRGPRYQQVVESCLFVPLHIKSVDLDGEEFQKYILANVVSPLMTDFDVLFDLGS